MFTMIGIVSRYNNWPGLEPGQLGRIWTRWSAVTSVTLIFFVSASNICAQTFSVCPSGCDFSSIQAAVDVAGATDVVLVEPGTYYEEVVIDHETTVRCNDDAAVCVVTAGLEAYSFTLNDTDFSPITVDGFTVNGGEGILVDFGSWNNTVIGNVVDDGHISLNYDANSNTIANNTVSGAEKCISLESARANTISDNAVTGCGEGIWLDFDSVANTLSGNHIETNASHGIYLSMSGSTIRENQIIGNGGEGIHSETSSGLNIEDNTISGNIGLGLYIGASMESTIKGNTFDGNGGVGIKIYGGMWNVVRGNTITNNVDAGITVEASHDNEIYDNYLENTSNALDLDTNIWSTTRTPGPNIVGGPEIGGNYWDDYGGSDSDGDGFGDTQYEVPGANNLDLLPLVPEPAPLLPDLVITDVRSGLGDICYSIENKLDGSAASGHTSSLEIDGVGVSLDVVDVAIPPHNGIDRCFSSFDWICSLSDDVVTVCADSESLIDEEFESNNCLTEIWNCAAEICTNAIDDDFDGLTDCDDPDCAIDAVCEDNDGDNFPALVDCDDDNPDIFPGAEEICDGRDNNCDGIVDDVGEDSDGDLIGDTCDNCPDVFNPDQSDNEIWAYWRMDEESDDKVVDSANSNHLFPERFPLDRTSGMIAGGIELHQESQLYSDKPGLDCSENAPGVTVEAWVYPRAMDIAYRHLLSVGSWGIMRGLNGRWQVAPNSTSPSQNVETGFPVVIDSWQHVAAVFTPEVGVRFYFNGEEFISDGLRAGWYDVPIRVGLYAGTPSIEGVLDEMAVYQGLLSAEEIAAHYNDGLARHPLTPFGDGLGDACDFCPSYWGGDPLDTDSDGAGDICDLDDDNDLCLDDDDEFPLIFGPDTDGDGEGDHCDMDDDGDGCLDFQDPEPLVAGPDPDGDGRPNECDNDDDGDGCWDSQDSDPLVPGPDLDGDGKADECDSDIDGDGCSNTRDSDPLVPGPDLDEDGIPDGCDDDVDGDGCPNDDDANPLSPSTIDTDGDGIADDCDPDDDNDGCPDERDPSPLTGSADPEGDGVGTDCDNCPDHGNSDQLDWDGDGVGDACDCEDGYTGENEDGADCGGICSGFCIGPCYPLIIQGSPRVKIDLVLVPAEDYGGDIDSFLSEAKHLILDDFGITAPIDENLDKFNFYYMEHEGQVGDAAGCGGTLPVEFTSPQCDRADAVGILHNTGIRDCSHGTKFTAKGDNSTRTFIHESGHAVFRLKDEYEDNHDPAVAGFCTSYRQNDTDGGPANIWSSLENCEEYAISSKWDPSGCNHFCDNNICCTRNSTDGWWKLDPEPEIMHHNQNGFGRACKKRMDWIFEQYSSIFPFKTALNSIGEEKTIKVFLHFLDSEMTHLRSRVGYGTPRDYRIQGSRYFVSLQDDIGNELYRFGLYDPTEVHPDPGAPWGDPANDFDFSIVMPFFPTLRNAVISDQGGKPVISVDLLPALREFCWGNSDDPDCEEYLVRTVGIDVKPGSAENCLNMNGHGKIPVAVLGGSDFDVESIDQSTLRFAGLEVAKKGKDREQCSIEDVSGDFTYPGGTPDGYPDLVCHFLDDLDLWMPGEGEATLTGELADGRMIEGTNEICLVPQNGGRKKPK